MIFPSDIPLTGIRNAQLDVQFTAYDDDAQTQPTDLTPYTLRIHIDQVGTFQTPPQNTTLTIPDQTNPATKGQILLHLDRTQTQIPNQEPTTHYTLEIYPTASPNDNDFLIDSYITWTGTL